MLIPYSDVQRILDLCKINIRGAFHIGAHNCEEIPFYEQLGINNLNNIVWIDAVESKVIEARERNIPNVYHATISDRDGMYVLFNVANNIESSSILPLGTHKNEHPDIHYTHSLIQISTSIDSFFKNNNINPVNHNFWNIDIQGAELIALRGSQESIQYADVIYLEVNQSQLYMGCPHIHELDIFLKGYGFVRMLTQMTEYNWGDALYIRKKK
jgi:FkbM family methyltransferase